MIINFYIENLEDTNSRSALTLTEFFKKLIDFNGMSKRPGLFHAWRFGNRIHCILIFTFFFFFFFFLVQLFLGFAFAHGYIKYRYQPFANRFV